MLKISKISFPGLGIGEFSVSSVAFEIFGIEIAWYALIITLGMVAAVVYTIFRAKRVGITIEDVTDIGLWTIPIGILGARLYYVISKPEVVHGFFDIFNIRGGGLAIYGGIIAGAITVYFACRYKKIPFLAFADCCTPGIILAQAIGRWGNFMNGEAFGGETDIFCRMLLSNNLTGHIYTAVHPTFLYESLWNLVGFALVNIFYSRKQYDGQVFIAVFGWYGLGRMLIEGLRADSLYWRLFGIEFRASQVLAGVIFAAAVGLLTYFAIRKPSGKLYFKNTESKK